jgi:hypothetical protein
MGDVFNGVGGRPGDPVWQDAWTKDMNVGVNQKFSQEATRSGPSAWAGMAKRNIANQGKQAMSDSADANAGSQAQGFANMAINGGADSGAKALLAAAGNKNALDANQKIRQQMMGNNLQTEMNDEQNRISQLSDYAGKQMQTDQFNSGNQYANNQAKNNFNKDVYEAKMKEWAAREQANATRASGGKK